MIVCLWGRGGDSVSWICFRYKSSRNRNIVQTTKDGVGVLEFYSFWYFVDIELGKAVLIVSDS